MTMKRIFPIALGMAMIAIASVQGYAFMMANSEVPAPAGEIDVVETVDQLKENMKDEELTCDEKLAKLDAALKNIDETLDTGVENESKFLTARDAIVQMRLELPCLGEQLVQNENIGSVISDQPIGEPTGGDGMPMTDGGFVDGGIISDGGTGFGESFGNVGSTGSTGGIGGQAAGGGGRAGLLAAGAAVAISVPLATSDDSAPGVPATR